ncbi:hypothetical protein D6C92_03463 [Aureobasidium pullulans]|nr:hypothetical protein D6C92_03463 [Aureobasidium pullulans]
MQSINSWNIQHLPPPNLHWTIYSRKSPQARPSFYYNSLSPKTRLMVGGGAMAYACIGLFLSDTAEEKLGYTPTEEDKRKLREAMPRIRVVEE